MVFQFDDLHQLLIRRNTTEYQSYFSQNIYIGIIKFITMPVSLIDQLFIIGLQEPNFLLRADRDRDPNLIVPPFGVSEDRFWTT